MELLPDCGGVEAKMIITRTPLRISLCGGGTDMPSFYKKHGGAVVSLAIDKYVYVSVNRKFDGRLRVSYSKVEDVEAVQQVKHDLVRNALFMHKIEKGIEITSVSDIPGEGTGLGSSSAFTVGLLRALGTDIEPAALAERAYMVEAEMCSHPVGKQDQYASAFGGVNYILFGKNNVSVSQMQLSSHWRKEFEKYALLLWTGQTRSANDILREQSTKFDNGYNVENGKHLANLARALFDDIAGAAGMNRIGELVSISWETKKSMVSGISDPLIDMWYNDAMKCGAYGGKLLGAGGGGFLFFLAPPDTHGKIEEATGLRKIPFHIEPEGSTVIYDS